MFNVAILTGRITADVELKYTPTGISVCNFTIAVERRYKQGEERQADFINIQAWRQTAEFISKNFQKGSLIGIEGAIQTRKYTDKDGKTRTAFEVVANDVQFVAPKRSQSNDEANSMPDSENDPMNKFGAELDGFQECTDEDLPF